jgi:hypothetical protein
LAKDDEHMQCKQFDGSCSWIDDTMEIDWCNQFHFSKLLLHDDMHAFLVTCIYYTDLQEMLKSRMTERDTNLFL